MKPIPRAQGTADGWIASVTLVDEIADEVNCNAENDIQWEEIDDVIKALVNRGYCVYERKPMDDESFLDLEKFVREVGSTTLLLSQVGREILSRYENECLERNQYPIRQKQPILGDTSAA